MWSDRLLPRATRCSRPGEVCRGPLGPRWWRCKAAGARASAQWPKPAREAGRAAWPPAARPCTRALQA
eukprot:14435059-Alexandrium_andersonii.AAC.1